MINIDDSFNYQITAWVNAAKAWIDSYCGREFEKEDATYKLYDGDGTKELLVDDILTVTKIETLDDERNVDETVDQVKMYWLYPENGTPKTRIVLDVRNAPIAVFPSGHQNIKITGTFGYSETVPADVQLAATKIVAGIIRESGINASGRVKAESLGDYSITYADIGEIANKVDAKDLLDHYRIINVGD